MGRRGEKKLSFFPEQKIIFFCGFYEKKSKNLTKMYVYILYSFLKKIIKV